MGKAIVVDTMHALDSLLDRSAQAFAGEPFIEEITELLRAVNERDLDALLGLGDEDFAVIDVDPTGETPLVRVQPEWEPWFRRFFLFLDALNATTDTELTDYRAIATSELGYSVAEFRHDIVGPAFIASFDCLATVIWKPTEDGWKEARWHCSITDRHIVIPDAVDDSSLGQRSIGL